MPRVNEGGFQVVIDPAEWYRLKKELDAFDPALARALRKRIKNAGQVAADAVKDTLKLPSPDGGPDVGHGRQALIEATKVSVSFAKRAAGASVVTTSNRLPEPHKSLLMVYNKRNKFRHPVFAEGENRDQWTWVEQQGRPYFADPIYKALDEALVNEVRAALDEATRAIGARAV